MKKTIMAALVAVWAVGCTRHEFRLDAVQDPARIASKSTPIWVDVEDAQMAGSRMAAQMFKSAMCREGIPLASSPEQARWRLSFGFAVNIEELGPTVSTWRIGYLWQTQYNRTYARHPVVHVAISPMTQPGTLPVWEAVATGTPKIFEVYQPLIFREILARWGQDWRAPVRLTKEARTALLAEPPCMAR